MPLVIKAGNFFAHYWSQLGDALMQVIVFQTPHSVLGPTTGLLESLSVQQAIAETGVQPLAGFVLRISEREHDGEKTFALAPMLQAKAQELFRDERIGIQKKKRIAGGCRCGRIASLAARESAWHLDD